MYCFLSAGGGPRKQIGRALEPGHICGNNDRELSLTRSDSALRCRKSSTDAALQTYAIFCTHGPTVNCTSASVNHASNVTESDFWSSHQFW